MAKPTKRRGQSTWLQFFKGLGAALAVTLAGVAVFALLMQWFRPADGLVRIINQLLKLLSIGVGVYVALDKSREGGVLRGALLGLAYMAVGVGVYALLAHADAPLTAYVADLAMGVAAGGLIGMVI